MLIKVRRLFLIIAASALAVLLLVSCGSSTDNQYFRPSDEEMDIMEDLIADQKKADERIEKELKSGKHTLDDPLVIKNPYIISPLTAIVIFNTEEETPISVDINDDAHVDFESSTEHALPIYGLYEDYENEVKLKDGSGKEKTITIKTDKYKGERAKVTATSLKHTDEFFLVSPDYACTSAYDEKGRLLWYLDTSDNEGAVIFLGNGRFLISDPYQGSGGIRINYSSFMEMDYLGKIHKLNIGEYGYHHEILRIHDDSEYLLPGQDEDSPFLQAVIYSADAMTMELKEKLDLYEIFKEHAPKWTKEMTKNGKFNLVVNGIDYDEKTGDVVCSIRATGMLMRVNMKTGEIKWIFADPENTPEGFKKYLITPSDDTRYPYGQHAPLFLSEGRLAYHNNDVPFLDQDQSLAHHIKNYSSNEILKIDEKNRTLSTEWTYDADRKILSKMSGSLEFMDNGHKLISYGSAMKKSAYEDPEHTTLLDFDHTEAVMMELDENDKTLWRATFPGVIHKVYRSTFYGQAEGGADTKKDDAGAEEVPNYEIIDYEGLNGQDQEKYSGEKTDIEEISSELKNAKKLDGTFYLMINRAVLDMKIADKDEIKLLFIDESERGTLFTYKTSGGSLPIVNSGKYGVQTRGLKGRQKAYVSVNGTWYDTGRIIDFS